MADYRGGAAEVIGRLLVVAAVTVSATACLAGDGASPAGVGVCTATDTVRILSGQDSVEVGKTRAITFVTSAASPNCLRWSSSNGFLARVSSGGIVQGLALGRVTIGVRSAASADSVIFTVVPAQPAK